MKMLNFSIKIFILLLSSIPVLSKGEGVSKDLFQCRQLCYRKFKQEWLNCMKYQECKNCWNSCDEILGPFPLRIISASRQGSLILTDIAWDQTITNISKQCLVTWEVSGGGLMGNLLTDGSTVELSLWADTIYHIQVTCRNKDSGTTRRSLKLIVDTRKLNADFVSTSTSTTTTSTTTIATTTTTTTTIHAISKNTNEDDHLQEVYASGELKQENQDRIHSKIFIKNNLKNIRNNLNHMANDHDDDNDDGDDSIESINHILSVQQSKLKGTQNSNNNYLNYSNIYYSKSILYTVIGIILLILGSSLIFILLRFIKYKSHYDNDELIHNGEIFLDATILHV